MSIIIPDDIVQSARISESELKVEIAVLLFDKYSISIGKARHFAGMNLLEFQREISSRGICIHYDVEEFEQDIKTLKELGRL